MLLSFRFFLSFLVGRLRRNPPSLFETKSIYLSEIFRRRYLRSFAFRRHPVKQKRIRGAKLFNTCFLRMCLTTTSVGISLSLITSTQAPGVVFAFSSASSSSRLFLARSRAPPKPIVLILVVITSVIHSISSINSDRSFASSPRPPSAQRSLCVLIAISSIPLLVSLAMLSKLFSTALSYSFRNIQPVAVDDVVFLSVQSHLRS